MATYGCAANQQSFLANSYSMDDTKVCRNYVKDRDKLLASYAPSDATEASYLTALDEQIERRKLTSLRCEQLVRQEDDRIAAGIMLGILAVGAVAIAAQSGGGGGGSSSYSGYTNDSYGHAWDQFYDGSGNLTWRCRDKSSGQFAQAYQCYGEPKSDFTWPRK